MITSEATKVMNKSLPNSHDVFVNWLNEELGYIENPLIVNEFYSLYNTLSNDTIILSEKENHIAEKIRNLYEEIKSVEIDKKKALELTNQAIKEIFLESFLSKSTYTNMVEKIKENSPLKELTSERLNRSDPLPTLDCLVILKEDYRNLNCIERMASLIASSGQLFLDVCSDSDSSYYYKNLFGCTVIPNKGKYELMMGDKSSYVCVFVGGQAYKLEIIEDNKVIPVSNIIVQLNLILSDYYDSDKHTPLGSLTSGFSTTSSKIWSHIKRISTNEKGINIINNSLFIACLDINTDTSDLYEASSSMYYHNYQNRWFGSTQLIVGKGGGAGISFSYLKGSDGYHFIEIANRIYNGAMRIVMPTNSVEDIQKIGPTQLYNKISFDIDKQDIALLEKEAESILNPYKSVYTLNVGKNFFKKAGVSPNVSMHLLLNLAAKDKKADFKIPISNHGVAVGHLGYNNFELDWLSVPVSIYQELIDKIDKGSDTSETAQAFKNAVNAHKDYINLSKKGLSPTFFIEKSQGEVFNILHDFYLKIGTEYNACYNNYLYQMKRRCGLVDIISSALVLKENIVLLGRPGVYMPYLQMFGVHVFMYDDKTKLVFTPNKEFSKEVQNVLNNLERWIDILKDHSFI